MSAALQVSATPARSAPVSSRIESLDWAGLHGDLDRRGWAATGPLLSEAECRNLVERYDDGALYRSRIVMARHNFGLGEYQYYRYPLPDLIDGLRHAMYPFLAPKANEWNELMGRSGYPRSLEGYLRRCHRAGQVRPTPLILRYAEDGYNCLHQDLYGELHFPLQLAVLLNEPGEEFRGGELVLTEQRPRMQSRVQVVPLAKGHGVIFAVNERPLRGKRDSYRVKMRHGVSPVTSGRRHTLGIIFHDAA
jgi:hypothetical protein